MGKFITIVIALAEHLATGYIARETAIAHNLILSEIKKGVEAVLLVSDIASSISN
ncbi:MULTISPECIES: hypothetical protein [unclassified Tolypothrix]|uniref:hypothetical protein n=1 Tax=unclassified Tolypothrix TaxID=2649714 RepID=UPI0005EABE82|nr:MULTISPECIES: hypothetical protein [unclassified Tolypothrix]EKF05915.1 hypothetical protein FDUTEX481_00265 [Tolypothrix sp. PCC 7601]MBE9086264.1 hypothetical protein [Tolypothrix sp. LEGE 11397]UYD26358.1 hypothetical protein HGR01_34585 [Tolypothrix sp. PCC 7712]UYD31406.1 hypothetical protein HG267_19920 [Tolypothrix sp. PCC 7601]